MYWYQWLNGFAMNKSDTAFVLQIESDSIIFCLYEELGVAALFNLTKVGCLLNLAVFYFEVSHKSQLWNIINFERFVCVSFTSHTYL